MFCSDTLCDTTPAVIHFINGISTACTSPSSGGSALQDGHCEQTPLPVMGHIFLTSLLCVSRLARKRQLLLQSVQLPASPPTASATPSVEEITAQSMDQPPSATAAGNTTFVRLVLSLLGQTMTKRAAPAPRASAPGDGNASPQAAPLPWWPATSAPRQSTQDVVYVVQCVGGESDGAGDNAGLCQAHVPSGGHAPVTSSTTANCRIILRSSPVPIFSSEMMAELALDAEQCASVASRTGYGSRAPGTDSSEDVDAEAVADSCVARALEVFDSCVRHHEEACLRQISKLGDLLEQLLERPAAEVHSAGEVASKGAPSATTTSDISQLGSCVSQLYEWTIDVPIYGVVLCVKDTHATRLERVHRLTTPLLQAATGCGDAAGGPLGPVTQTLAKLHTWCAASTTTASSTSSTSLGTPSCTPAIRTLTRSHVTELRRFVAGHFEKPQTAAARPLGPANPATVSYGASLASATPACIVHCQLGVSRSPSVVMLFYMDVFAPQLRAALSAAAAPLSIFDGLLSALVQARPQVRPNVCFAAQLLSLWKQWMRSGTPVGPAGVM
ncbi:hypothetical protein LPMP_130660 [Leishmania panamensis]|uniref:Phosphotyrosine protein, putative n=1 Tax=Leishmania panamensis TaxID=5679 RepID=A0A088RKY1_LEIPA|nr:hypothetical protein LPMP_130660 [Leishmania panamensis]AIN96495.1 hypothetical protein LPMP_130660 [Leishmania panamensis]